MYVKKPRFSIITACLNRADFIETAIKSVIDQNYQPYEHIIMDGGSTDGTLDLLKLYPHLRVHSSQDQGMYDALNKGIKIAKGEIVGFLNSDDLYAENVFSCVAEKFSEQKKLAVAGDALVFTISPEGETNIIRSFSPQGASLLNISTVGDPFFNSWFFHKSVFEKLGNFNIHYRIAADRDFMLRFALSGLEHSTINRLVYRYRQHLNSMTFNITEDKLRCIINEKILWATAYFGQNNLPLEARSLIRQFHTRDTIEMAVRSLRKLNFVQFAYYSKMGIKYDSLWFKNFTRRIRHKELL